MESVLRYTDSRLLLPRPSHVAWPRAGRLSGLLELAKTAESVYDNKMEKVIMCSAYSSLGL